MSGKFRIANVVIILSLVLLAACKSQGDVEPTLNPDTIYTAAAMTVEAQLTQAAIQNPSPTNTSLPPTDVILPTQTLQAGAETQVATQQTTPGQLLMTSTPFVLSTFTATPPPPSAQGKYELVDQTPDDRAVLPPGYKFDMTWSIKNTGTTTWNQQYTIEFFIGDRIGGGHYTINRYYFRADAKPGDTVNVFVDMMTPVKNGEYYSWWKLKDDMGNNFGDVDVTIIVSDTAVAP